MKGRKAENERWRGCQRKDLTPSTAAWGPSVPLGGMPRSPIRWKVQVRLQDGFAERSDVRTDDKVSIWRWPEVSGRGEMVRRRQGGTDSSQLNEGHNECQR
jgi:hypothetical protein